MASSVINFDDKELYQELAIPESKKLTYQNVNDIKNAVNNHAGLIDSHSANTSNPHSVTKSQVGLGNVDNTSDANKPVSTATQTELDLKAASSSLTSHTNNTSNPHSVTAAQVGAPTVSEMNAAISTAIGSISAVSSVSITGTISLDSSHFNKILLCSGTSADYTIDLPTAVGNSGGSLILKGISAFTKVATIQGVSGQLIDGESNRKISTDGLIALLSDGSNWIVVNEVGSWIPYTPVWGGFSVDPTIIRSDYWRVGKMCRARVIINGAGTSTTSVYTITIPFNAAEVCRAPVMVLVNGGTAQTFPGIAQTRLGANTVDLYRDASFGTWGTSAQKRGDLDITFRIQ